MAGGGVRGWAHRPGWGLSRYPGVPEIGGPGLGSAGGSARDAWELFWLGLGPIARGQEKHQKNKKQSSDLGHDYPPI